MGSLYYLFIIAKEHASGRQRASALTTGATSHRAHRHHVLTDVTYDRATSTPSSIGPPNRTHFVRTRNPDAPRAGFEFEGGILHDFKRSNCSLSICLHLCLSRRSPSSAQLAPPSTTYTEIQRGRAIRYQATPAPEGLRNPNSPRQPLTAKKQQGKEPPWLRP